MSGSPTPTATAGRTPQPNCDRDTLAVALHLRLRLPTLGPMPTGRTRRARAARKRRRRLDAVSHDLSAAEWAALKAAWGGCAYCGATDRPLQRDCVMAISRGGRYTLDNVVPACGPCNAGKCNAEVLGWLRRKRYDERAFLQRYLDITEAVRATAS